MLSRFIHVCVCIYTSVFYTVVLFWKSFHVHLRRMLDKKSHQHLSPLVS
jgi:hypothetical protein